MGTDGHPTAIRLRSTHRAMVLEWPGSIAVVSYAMLRVECPCPECRRIRQHGGSIAADADVAVVEARPMGPNALQLVFSDGHDRGIFPFTFLTELALAAP